MVADSKLNAGKFVGQVKIVFLRDDVMGANDIDVRPRLIAEHSGVRQGQRLHWFAQWDPRAHEQAGQKEIIIVIEHRAGFDGAGRWVEAGGDIVNLAGMRIAGL